MKRILTALALGGLCALPALAQDDMMADAMACADYAAMDSAGQMEAMAAMEGEAAADASAEAMSAEDMMAATTEACAAHPDMMVGEAMEAMGN